MGHSDRVTSVDYSADGNYILTGGMDQVVKLWETKTGFLVRTFKGHKGMVYQAKFSPDGKYFYSCSHDDKLFIKWETATGKMVLKKEMGINAMSDFSLSRDGLTIYAPGDDTLLVLKNDLSVQKKIRVPFLEELLMAPEFDKLYLYCDDYQNKLIKVYSISNLSKIDEIPCPNGLDYFSISGNKLLTGNHTKIHITDINTKKTELVSQTDSIYFSTAVLTPNGKEVIFSYMDGRIYKIDEKGEKNLLPTNHSAMIVAMEFSRDGKYLVTASYDWSAQLIETSSGRNIKWFRSNCDFINHFQMGESGSKIGFISGNLMHGTSTGIWNLQNGRFLNAGSRNKQNEAFMNVSFNEKQSAILTANSTGETFWYNYPKSSTVWSFFSGNSVARCVALTPNGKNGIVGTRDGNIIFWRPERNKMETIQVSNDGICAVDISADGTLIVAGTDGGQIILISYAEQAVINTLESHSAKTGYYDTTWVLSYGSLVSMQIDGISKPALNSASITDVKFSVTGDSVLVSGGNWINLFNTRTGIRLNQFVQTGAGFGCVDLRADGKKVIASGADGIVRIYSCETGELETELIGHQNEVRAVTFSKSNDFVISASLDAQFKIWDLNQKKELLSALSANGGKDFIIYNPAGYYFASKGASSLLSYRIGNRILPFDQFDLQFNRPDLIMKELSRFTTAALGTPVNGQLIKSYFNAYSKRLQRMKYSETQFTSDLHLPVVSLTREKTELSTNDSILRLSVKSLDTKYQLSSLHIMINGVPVFDKNGIRLNGKEINSALNLTLSQGVNRISVYCLNEKGVKSLVEGFEINYLSNIQNSKIYFIGIGVQNYLDTNYNLKYSVKDITDIEKMYAEKYPNSERTMLLNEQVTRENIIKLKEKLMKTSVNDEVVILLSGHGLLSEDLNFYYATHNVNFAVPEARGILFEEIEFLFEGIPARKKMLLIDACHSGELDKSEVAEQTNAGGVGTKTFNAKGQKMMIGLGNSFELMKEIFSDLQKGTGTTIISSSSGKYFSYEYDEYKNGVFTYALKEALDGKADSNFDGQLSVSEIQTYLTKRVSELTKGKQEPTSRQINTEMDFRVW